eukprot:gene19563-26245_t
MDTILIDAIGSRQLFLYARIIKTVGVYTADVKSYMREFMVNAFAASETALESVNTRFWGHGGPTFNVNVPELHMSVGKDAGVPYLRLNVDNETSIAVWEQRCKQVMQCLARKHTDMLRDLPTWAVKLMRSAPTNGASLGEFGLSVRIPRPVPINELPELRAAVASITVQVTRVCAVFETL